MTLRTHKTTHFLMTGLSYILTYASPRFIKCRTSWTQFHRTCIMTIGAANGVHHLVAPVAPFGSIECVRSFFAHQSWYVGPFTSPACSGLHICLSVYAWTSRTQNLPQIFNTMPVSARRIVFAREGISVPNNYYFGAHFQYIFLLRPVVEAFKSSVFRHGPRLIFPWEIFGELFVLRNYRVVHLNASIIEHACNFGSALKK